MAATMDRPSSDTPLTAPRSTFHARPACLPAVPAAGRAHRLPIGPEGRVGLGAPVRGRVVLVVEVARARVWHRQQEHRLVPDLLAVDPGDDARRIVLTVHDSVPLALDRPETGR